jgi:signal transduction histidine kinase
VRDTGPGIPPEEHQQLFQRFERGTVGHESGYPGTGLGLSIAKEIVERHGGWIEVISEGVPGKGTTFSVWLSVNGKT